MTIKTPLSLSDTSMQMVRTAASSLPVQRRGRFLSAVAHELVALDADVDEAAVHRAVGVVLGRMTGEVGACRMTPAFSPRQTRMLTEANARLPEHQRLRFQRTVAEVLARSPGMLTIGLQSNGQRVVHYLYSDEAVCAAIGYAIVKVERAA